MNDEKVELKSGESVKSAPVSILDLIVLTAAAAFALRIGESLEAVGWSYETDNVIFKVASTSIFVLVFALPFTAVFRLYQQRKNSGQACHHPGHWALAGEVPLVTAYAVFAMSVGFVDENLFVDNSNADSLYLQGWTILFGILSFVGAVIYFIASRGQPMCWKLFFLGYAVRALLIGLWPFMWLLSLSMFFSMFAMLTNILTFACFALLLFTAMFERGKQRDFLHWIGALHAFVLVAVQPILQYVYIFFVIEPGK